MRIRQVLLSSAVVTTFVLAGSAPAIAAGPGAYAGHVRDCARTTGLSSTCNPGMHHGVTGWDGMTC